DAVRLRDEQRRERAVHHRAVEIERIPERQNEARDLLARAEALELLERLRIRGFAACRAERKHDRLLDQVDQAADPRAEEQEAREREQHPKKQDAEIELAHELA